MQSGPWFFLSYFVIRSPAALKIHDSMSKVPSLLDDRPFTGRASCGLPGATLRLVQHHQVHPSHLPYFTWLSYLPPGHGCPGQRLVLPPVSKSLSTLRASAPALSIVLGPCRCSKSSFKECHSLPHLTRAQLGEASHIFTLAPELITTTPSMIVWTTLGNEAQNP